MHQSAGMKGSEAESVWRPDLRMGSSLVHAPDMADLRSQELAQVNGKGVAQLAIDEFVRAINSCDDVAASTWSEVLRSLER